jgi:hypothetical protein
MNIIKEIKSLSNEEKISILLTLTMVLVAVVIVLYSFLASRGQDVEYFKHRLGLMEQRLNNMDIKTDSLVQNDVKLKNSIDDISHLTLELDKAQRIQQAEIEAWKKLPRLPTPQQSNNQKR